MTEADVADHQERPYWCGYYVTPLHLFNYVLYAPTTADVNPSTNATYTVAEIEAYKDAIPTSGRCDF